MKRIILSALVVLLGFSVIGCSSGEANSEKESEVDWSLVEESYVYAFPLVLMDATAVNSTNTVEATDSKAPVNQLIHAKHLANAESKQVVSPNVDTIYSQAFLDLADDAMVFYKPASDRFLSIELLDYYTNSVAILGTGGDTQEAVTYLITGPDWDDPVPEGVVQIEMPTNNAWLLGRTVVYGDNDYEAVYALQDQMKLVPFMVYLTQQFEYEPLAGTYNAAHEYVPVEKTLGMEPQEFFDRANELMVENPPTDADADLIDRMASLGIGPGLEFDGAILGGDAQSKWTEMLQGLEPKLTESSAPFKQVPGSWEYFGDPIAQFGTEYDYRALIALGGLGANPTTVAIYPRAETDSTEEQLDGENAYRIHFEKDQLPPTNQYGFWSVTAYGDDDFLIANELDRYAINDRSDLTFNEDGSLDILVQATSPDDQSMLGNWLPVNDEKFHLYLRIYLPSSEVINGSWTMPTIIKTS